MAVVSTQTNLFGLLSVGLYLNLLAASGPNNLFLIVGDFFNLAEEGTRRVSE